MGTDREQLLAVIGSFTGQIPPEQLQDMEELVKAGERGIALENLCTQLYEYDVAVEPSVLADIREMGQAMGIAGEYWEPLAAKSL